MNESRPESLRTTHQTDAESEISDLRQILRVQAREIDRLHSALAEAILERDAIVDECERLNSFFSEGVR